MQTIIIAVIGAFMNYVRGGNMLAVVGKKYGETWQKRLDAVDKLANDLVYAAVMSFSLPILNIFAFGVLFFSMWIGRAQSWGKYFGTIIRKEVQTSDGVEFINNIVFAGKTDFPRLRATAALSIIGAIWSTALAGGLFIAYTLMGAVAPSTLLLLIPAGGAFGLIVLGSVEAMGVIKGQHEGGRNQGWWLSEIVMGAWLWGAAACLGV